MHFPNTLQKLRKDEFEDSEDESSSSSSSEDEDEEDEDEDEDDEDDEDSSKNNDIGSKNDSFFDERASTITSLPTDITVNNSSRNSAAATSRSSKTFRGSRSESRISKNTARGSMPPLSESHSDALPPGWTEQKHPQGTYYWNYNTGVTSWDRREYRSYLH